jgi:TP901 family phage tail tape measure protein
MGLDAGVLADLVVNLRADLTELSQGLGKAELQVAKWSTKASKEIDKFSSSTKSMGQSLSRIGSDMAFVGAGIVGSLGVGLAKFGSLEEKFADIKDVLGEDVEAFESVEDAVLSMAVRTGTASESLATSFTDVQIAVKDAAASLSILDAANNLAVAKGSELEDATRGLVSLMEIYGDELKNAADGADLMYKASLKSRSSMEQLSQASGQFLPIAKALGVSAEDIYSVYARQTIALGGAEKASSALTGVLKGLIKPTDELETKVEEWFGMTIQQTLAQGKFLEVFQKLGQLEQEELNRLVPSLAGMKGLFAITSDMNGIRKDSIDLKNRESIVDKESAEDLTQLNNIWKKLREEIKVFTYDTMKPLIPMIKEFASETVPMTMSSVKSWVEQNKGLIETVLKVSAVIGPALLIFGSMSMAIGKVVSIIAGFSDIMGKLVGLFPKLAMVISPPTGLIVVLTALATALGAVVLKFIDMKQAQEALETKFKDSSKVINEQSDLLIKKMEERYGKQLKNNEGMAAEFEHVKQLVKERQSLYAEMQAGQELSDGEVFRLNSLSKEIDVATSKMWAMNQTKKEETEITKQATEAKISNLTTSKELEEVEQKIADMRSYTIQQMDVVNEKYTEGKIKLSELSTVQGLLNEQLASTTNDFGALADKIIAVSQNPYIVKLNFELSGANELLSVEQEIKQAEHEILMLGKTGFEEKKAQLAYELEQTLLSIEIRKREREIEHNQRMAQLKIEQEKLVADIKSREDLELAQKKALIDEWSQYYVSIKKQESEVFNVTLQGYETLESRVTQLHTLKLKQAKESIEAQQQEASAVKEVANANKDATVSYLERADAQRQSFASASSTQTTSGLSFASFSEAEAYKASSGESFLQNYSVGSYATGKRFVPKTGLYQLHEGERVTPKNSVGPGEQMNITIVNKIDSGFINDMLANDPSTIINIIGSDVANNGLTRKAVSSLLRRG